MMNDHDPIDLAFMKRLRTEARQAAGTVTEGGTSPEEMLDLRKLADRIGAGLIFEIGMNAAYSTHAFLADARGRHVVSFDIGTHDYVHNAKRRLDALYPDRHNLVLGNSLETVPKFAAENPHTKAKLIFIDGGHSFKCAWNDIINMHALSDVGTCVVMDDTTPYRSYGRNPYKAWNEAELEGYVMHLYYVQDGVRVQEPDKTGTHVWAVGMYNHERNQDD